jgi:hypothetical protein
MRFARHWCYVAFVRTPRGIKDCRCLILSGDRNRERWHREPHGVDTHPFVGPIRPYEVAAPCENLSWQLGFKHCSKRRGTFMLVFKTPLRKQLQERGRHGDVDSIEGEIVKSCG